ncbi:hypothetical protein V1477_014136 [Vespula maculifrons]|uniref:Uncharacterized protein n=1 Tax=Vespula maculifrons TaxID=7453 RepID=A0ABD2BK69_VESMC
MMLNIRIRLKRFWKRLKYAAIRPVVLALHNLGLDFNILQVLPTQVPPRGESKTTGRPPLPTNSSLQTLKLQPHASPHLGTDLRIAQLSNIGSFDHHFSTTGRAFATNAGTQN